MDDLTFSFKMMLEATYGKPNVMSDEDFNDKFPFAKELLDYVHSPEYRQLMIKEREDINLKRKILIRP